MMQTQESEGPARSSLFVMLRLGEKGMALLTVLVFAFIFLVGTMTFFTLAGYESGLAESRENSSRAFFIAEAGIERCKDKLLEDGHWAAGLDSVPFDGGFYSVTVDTVMFEDSLRTRFYSEGHFQGSKRDVEVIANIKAATLGLAIYARNDMILQGNICLDGFAHANDEIINDDHFVESDACDGMWDSGYGMDPPPAYTHPDSFPGATYYYIAANDGPGKQDTLFIKDRNWNTLSYYVKGVTVPGRPHPDMDWSYEPENGGTLNLELKPTNALDQAVGAFPRAVGDFTVVINFGGLQSYMNHARTNMLFHESGNFLIESTIINTRYSSTAGTSTAERLTASNWTGGSIETKVKTVFNPLYCIAFLAQSVTGNAQVFIGTEGSPALSYVMEHGNFANGQWTIYGSLISLSNITVGGGVNLTFDPAFIECLPPSLSLNWPIGASGVMEILQWREPPPRT